MQKQEIVDLIIKTIAQELDSASKAALESAHEATDEESRPENKYDTRALETSYVASAQAGYAKDLKAALQAYRNLSLPKEPHSGPAAIGSLVTTLGNAGREQFFIGPARGGLEIATEAGSITVLTPKSPLGHQLIGKSLGGSAGDRRILRVE
ncbi:transcription elongation factor GreAB [Pelagicoccus sp. NFK12]|uniref:Transcription elongation factor GreAB n=1 Tax=Pelagicoccus enzymogenes TaxID=2773457 RepID=A0A927FEB0_9BACT|nr:transcription elongation factor GreAB [Pelagicoccus enzymogenes]MBD5781818.1 transcription elongation factor GreAB [Pelagicoccus enzymogenes]